MDNFRKLRVLAHINYKRKLKIIGLPKEKVSRLKRAVGPNSVKKRGGKMSGLLLSLSTVKCIKVPVSRVVSMPSRAIKSAKTTEAWHHVVPSEPKLRKGATCRI